nr:aminotransferase class V-fold PLP-dependent enzyme [Lachnospiraceae bacterium]
TILSDAHVAVRAGHHCAQPLLKFLGVRSTARVSLAFYNDETDVKRFLDAVAKIRPMMGYPE